MCCLLRCELSQMEDAQRVYLSACAHAQDTIATLRFEVCLGAAGGLAVVAVPRIYPGNH